MYPHDIYVYLSFMPDTIEEIWLYLLFTRTSPFFCCCFFENSSVCFFTLEAGARSWWRLFFSWISQLLASSRQPATASQLAQQQLSSQLWKQATTWTRHARVFNQVRVNVSENNVCPKLLLLQVLKHCIRQRCYRQWTQLASFGEYCDAARRQALKC